ncbi:MAG TPA: GntR family transcriptional regulator [Gaiellales bacterium]|jgi:DNA-binding GntR family transcriptional regulator
MSSSDPARYGGAEAAGPRLLATISVVEALETELTRRLLGGDLRPGDRLREVELAEHYGVGRYTLRAAFDGLVRRGLLQRERGRGVTVAVLGPDDFVEIYEARMALEAQAARTLAARRAVPDAAREALDRLDRLPADADWRLVADADLGFHRALVAATGNRRLQRMHADLEVEILLGMVQLGAGYATMPKLAAEHRALLAAIAAGRPGAAERAARSHLGDAAAWFAQGATA